MTRHDSRASASSSFCYIFSFTHVCILDLSRTTHAHLPALLLLHFFFHIFFSCMYFRLFTNYSRGSALSINCQHVPWGWEKKEKEREKEREKEGGRGEEEARRKRGGGGKGRGASQPKRLVIFDVRAQALLCVFIPHTTTRVKPNKSKKLDLVDIDIQMYRCTDIQIYRYTDIQI